MGSMLLVGMVVLFVAGCSDLSDSPTDPFQTAPTVQMSHIGASDPDLCGYSCVDESPVLDSSTTPTNSTITVFIGSSFTVRLRGRMTHAQNPLYRAHRAFGRSIF